MADKTWLVLCAEDDLDALWAWRELRAGGLDPVELVTSGMLSCALRWSHELGDGPARVEFDLADGRTLRSTDVAGALNRLTHVPLSAALVSPEDRAYAGQEWNAFLLSWLHCLPGPMLNRPSPHGLAGANRHPTDWTYLASKAGLPVITLSEGSELLLTVNPKRALRALVIGETVLNAPVPGDDFAAACRRLAAVAGCGLLGVDFEPDATGCWRFRGATPSPGLRNWGRPLIAALAATLRNDESTRRP